MTTPAPTHVNHHSYIVPGLVDGAVTMAQAERRRDRDNETTIVHAHRYDDSQNLCNLKCRVIEPGYKTRSIGEERVPIQEEKY